MNKRVHRAYSTKKTRWMHEADAVIPIKKEETLSFKDWLYMVAITAGATVFFLFVYMCM